MQPTILSKSEMVLVGMSFYGDPFDVSDVWTDENQIGRLWKRFTNYFIQHGKDIQYCVEAGIAYEVHLYNDETREKGVLEVFVGVQVAKIDAVPLELLVKILPATEYAIFTFDGEDIISSWETDIDKWLTEAGYQRAHPYSMQYYDDERFKGMDRIAESSLDVYMPVKKLQLSYA